MAIIPAAPIMIARTLPEWNELGYRVIKGQKRTGRNEQGQATSTSEQVVFEGGPIVPREQRQATATQAPVVASFWPTPLVNAIHEQSAALPIVSRIVIRDMPEHIQTRCRDFFDIRDSILDLVPESHGLTAVIRQPLSLIIRHRDTNREIRFNSWNDWIARQQQFMNWYTECVNPQEPQQDNRTLADILEDDTLRQVGISRDTVEQARGILTGTIPIRLNNTWTWAVDNYGIRDEDSDEEERPKPKKKKKKEHITDNVGVNEQRNIML